MEPGCAGPLLVPSQLLWSQGQGSLAVSGLRQGRLLCGIGGHSASLDLAWLLGPVRGVRQCQGTDIPSGIDPDVPACPLHPDTQQEKHHFLSHPRTTLGRTPGTVG